MPPTFDRRRGAALLLAVLLLSLLPAALAEVCRQELITALPNLTLDRAPTGIDAARALKRAVDLVEPALPPLRSNSKVPLDASDANYAVVKYLADRRLLPDSWQANELDGAAWAAMLSAFLAWYELPGVNPGAPATADELVGDVGNVLQRVSGAIRPAALLATDPAQAGRTTFWAIIWNWTVYPRLLVIRPSGDAMAQPSDVLPRLSNCAVNVSAYILAPQETAKSLFLTHNTSRMIVVASKPGQDGLWPYEVPAGEELGAFAYGLPDLASVDVYAAVFDGPSVGIGTLLGMLPRVRTNISPLSLGRYLQTP